MIADNVQISSGEKKEPNLKDLVLRIHRWIKFLFSKWVVISLISMIGGLIGIYVAWKSPITYTSNLTFVLEEGKSSSGLSAVAGQFGLDIGSMSGTSNMLSGDNIIGLLKSRRFTEKVLLTRFEDNKNYSLADKYVDAYELRSLWKKNKSIGKDIFFEPKEDRKGYTRIQDSLLQIIESNILEKQLVVDRTDKKMTLFKVNATFKNELLSKYFTERLVKDVISFYIETKTKRQWNNVDRLQRRADSIGRLLNRKTYVSASDRSELLDVNPAHQIAVISAEVSGRDKMMLGTIYGEVVKNLEIQKASLTQETPTIQVVDDVMLPLKKNKKSRLSYLIIGGFFAGVIVSLLLTFLKWIRK